MAGLFSCVLLTLALQHSARHRTGAASSLLPEWALQEDVQWLCDKWTIEVKLEAGRADY